MRRIETALPGRYTAGVGFFRAARTAGAPCGALSRRRGANTSRAAEARVLRARWVMSISRESGKRCEYEATLEFVRESAHTYLHVPDV